MLTGSVVGLQNGDNISALYTTGATTNSAVGSYPITIGLLDPDHKLGNYSVTTNHGTLSVTAAPLSVAAADAVRAYGAANPVLSGTITGIQNNDNLTATYTTAATPTSPVGTYPITPTLVDPGGMLGNYTVATTNGTLSVQPAALTVTANNISRPYGAPNPPLTGTISGVQNGDNITATYASKSLAVAAAVLARDATGNARLTALLAVLMWSVGVILYVVVATLVLARLLLLTVRPEDLTPPYWVTMGATAITVLAAAQILRMAPAPAVAATRPIVAGFGVMLWAFGTWLIPLLVVFGMWRHVLRKVRLSYLPALWSIVFPLGMYATASMELGRAASLPIIEAIGRAWTWTRHQPYCRP